MIVEALKCNKYIKLYNKCIKCAVKVSSKYFIVKIFINNRIYNVINAYFNLNIF